MPTDARPDTDEGGWPQERRPLDVGTRGRVAAAAAAVAAAKRADAVARDGSKRWIDKGGWGEGVWQTQSPTVARADDSYPCPGGVFIGRRTASGLPKPPRAKAEGHSGGGGRAREGGRVTASRPPLSREKK